MKKTILIISLLIVLSILVTGCNIQPRNIVTNPDHYDRHDGIRALDYFPEKLDGYDVIKYEKHDFRFYYAGPKEIYLELSATPEQIDKFIGGKSKLAYVKVKQAFYDSDYTEISMEDSYGREDDSPDEGFSCDAKIEKIIYSKAKGVIIFVYVSAGANEYRLSDFIYFNRFGIDRDEYLAHDWAKTNRSKSVSDGTGDSIKPGASSGIAH